MYPIPVVVFGMLFRARVATEEFNSLPHLGPLDRRTILSGSPGWQQSVLEPAPGEDYLKKVAAIHFASLNAKPRPSDTS